MSNEKVLNFDPNALFYYMVNTYSQNKTKDNQIIFCNEGGMRCFDGDTLIHTPTGVKPIKDITQNDFVKSYNHTTQKIEYKRVIGTASSSEHGKKCLNIKLKNGNVIKCTEDHEFYYQGRYVEAKHFISLLKK